MTFDREEFDNFLLENDCIKFYNEPIELRSGRLSWWDADFKELSIKQKKQLAKYVYNFAMDRNLKPDIFLGIPYATTVLGINVNELIDYKDQSEVPATILRAEYRTYGDLKYRYAVGPLETGEHVVLIDDAIATGNSFMRHIDPLQRIGVVIDGIIVCVDRLERRDSGGTAAEVLRETYHAEYFPITDAGAILPKAYRLFKPDRIIAENIENYYKMYGVREIKLL